MSEGYKTWELRKFPKNMFSRISWRIITDTIERLAMDVVKIYKIKSWNGMPLNKHYNNTVIEWIPHRMNEKWDENHVPIDITDAYPACRNGARAVQFNSSVAPPNPLWNNFQNILNSYFQSLKLQPGWNAGWIVRINASRHC